MSEASLLHSRGSLSGILIAIRDLTRTLRTRMHSSQNEDIVLLKGWRRRNKKTPWETDAHADEKLNAGYVWR